MKFMILPVLLFVAAATSFTANAANEVRVDFKIVDKSPKVEKPKPTKGAPPPPKPEQDVRMLEINLTNTTKNDYKGLKVLALFVTRVRGEAALNIESSEELSADIAPGGKAELKTKEVIAIFTPAGIANKKRVKASGSKFAGYGVQVYNGETVVGESFSPPSLKATLEKQPH